MSFITTFNNTFYILMALQAFLLVAATSSVYYLIKTGEKKYNPLYGIYAVAAMNIAWLGVITVVLFTDTAAATSFIVAATVIGIVMKAVWFVICVMRRHLVNSKLA